MNEGPFVGSPNQPFLCVRLGLLHYLGERWCWRGSFTDGTFKGFIEICKFDCVRHEAIRFTLRVARTTLLVATGGTLQCHEIDLRRRGAREGTGTRIEARAPRLTVVVDIVHQDKACLENHMLLMQEQVQSQGQATSSKLASAP